MKKKKTYPDYVQRKEAAKPGDAAKRKAGKARAKAFNDASLKKQNSVAGCEAARDPGGFPSQVVLSRNGALILAVEMGANRGAKIMRVILCALSIGLALGPMAYFLSHSVQIDSAPEFIYYRIGDALSLLGGEASYVRPVQGIPNAILSKLVVWIIGDAITTREGLSLYGIMFGALLAVPVVASIVYAWIRLPVSVALAQLLILALPFWFGTASDGLMVAPDYWQAELVFLAITLPLIFELPKLPANRAYIIAGVWAGIGASIKVTLFPISLLLIVFIQQWTLRRVVAMFTIALLTFAALDLIYMANVREAAKLLEFQGEFYLRPNASAYYTDFWSAFLFRPIVPMLTAAVLILCVVKRSAAALAIVGWAAVYLYLVAKRPHDTSMASFGISLGFMAAFLALQFERRALILSALVVVAFVGAYSHSFHEIRNFTAAPRPQEDLSRAQSFFPDVRAVWFIPSNDWNATYGPQGFAYNGGLAIRPIEKRGALRRLFPHAEIALTLGELRELENGAAAIYWTRPADSDPRPLFAALGAARIEETPVMIRGNNWILGKARHAP